MPPSVLRPTSDRVLTRAAGASAAIARAARAGTAAPRATHAPARATGAVRGWLMTGVSYVIPFVATGGLLVALGYAFGGPAVRDAQPLAAGVAWLDVSGWAALAFQLGTLTFTLIVPALAGSVAFAVAGRPSLVPGVVGGLAALHVGAGYLGGIAAGLLAGAAVRFADRTRPPRSLSTAWYVVLLPLITSVFTGAVMVLALGGPLAALSTGLTQWLSTLSAGDAVLAGCVIGVLVSIDLGGPANKAVYGFAVSGLAAGAPGATATMAAVMAAGMVPPLAMATATTVRKRLFDAGERANGRAAWITGAVFVTEGAIPFAAADPLRVIPSIVAGAGVTGGLVMAMGVATPVPHGGVLALPVVLHPIGFVLALTAGVVVAAGLVIVAKSRAVRVERSLLADDRS